VGLSGAGKSTVAPHVAEILECPWCDLDARIVAREGRSIAEIFAAEGEAHFRGLERAELAAVLLEAPQVVAAGAGWAAQPGNLALVAGQAFVLHLSVTVEEAARRLANASDRPLLAENLVEQLSRQLLERDPWYQRADIEVAVGGVSAEAVAAGVATAARQYGGW
jgi:shikimate kinase